MAFIFQGAYHKYTALKATAIMGCAEESEEYRENAVYVKEESRSGEVTEWVVFGWDVPKADDVNAWEAMCICNGAWAALQPYHHLIIEE